MVKGGTCIICGSTKQLTVHHMKDIHSKQNIKRPKVNGVIYLCRDCHDVVEDVVNKGKARKLWFKRGYNQAIEDFKKYSENVQYDSKIYKGESD